MENILAHHQLITSETPQTLKVKIRMLLQANLSQQELLDHCFSLFCATAPASFKNVQMDADTLIGLGYKIASLELANKALQQKNLALNIQLNAQNSNASHAFFEMPVKDTEKTALINDLTP